MALLAQPKRKEKYGFDPRNTNWASDDSKFGQKLMEKMGWEKGKGLGANEDGIIEHIKASYKQDTRGLGSTPKDADAWIAHQDDFNDLLKKLNGESGEADACQTSNQDNQAGRKRFLGRFARGRVQTLRTTDDLDCILGRRKASEPSTPTNQSATNSDDDERESSLKTVTSSCSVQEYFAKKMKEIKSRNSTDDQVKTDVEDLQSSNKLVSAGDRDQATPVPVYGAVQFSYDDEEKPPLSNEEKGRGWYSDQEWKENNAKNEHKKKKKKSKKSDTVEESGNPVENDVQNDIPKKRKKKGKLECDATSPNNANEVREISVKTSDGDTNTSMSDLTKKKKKKKRKLDEDENLSENVPPENPVQDKTTDIEINKKRKRSTEEVDEEHSTDKMKKKKKKRKIEEENEPDISTETKMKKRKGDIIDHVEVEYVSPEENENLKPKAKKEEKKKEKGKRKEMQINGSLENIDTKMESAGPDRNVESKETMDTCDQPESEGNSISVQKNLKEKETRKKEKKKSKKAPTGDLSEEANVKIGSKMETIEAADDSDEQDSSSKEKRKNRKGKSKKMQPVNTPDEPENCEKQGKESNSTEEVGEKLKKEESAQKKKKKKRKNEKAQIDDSLQVTGDSDTVGVKEKLDDCEKLNNEVNLTEEDDKNVKPKEPSQSDRSSKKEKRKKEKGKSKEQMNDSLDKSTTADKTEIIESVNASINQSEKSLETANQQNNENEDTSPQATNVQKIKRQGKKKKRKTKKDLNASFPGSNFGELNGYEPLNFSKS